MIESIEEFLKLYNDEIQPNQWRFEELSDELWEELVENEFPRDTLLLNKKVPVKVLSVFMNDSSERIRSMVADKRSAGPLLTELAMDKSPMVRGRVVNNAKATEKVLRMLLNDSEKFIAARAAERLGLPFDKPQLSDIITVFDEPDNC